MSELEKQNCLETLYQGHTLTRSQMAFLFGEIVQGQLTDIELTAMLTALKLKGETVDELCGAVDASLAAAQKFERDMNQPVIDIVGTGGDGHNTINISTTTAFVVAACGVKVAKHGNRSVSSKSGSSDLLAQLGVNIAMSAATASQSLRDNGLCFLFAPSYHSGFKHAVNVRQQLKTRTLFNILGPLINPARPEFMLLGVYTEQLIEPIAKVLLAIGVKRAMVVHGSGLDEVAIHGITQVAEINNGVISHYEISPTDFGLVSHSLSNIVGGAPAENAAITQAILQGKAIAAHTDAVIINAACALYIAGKSDSLISAAQLARETIESALPYKKLLMLKNISQEAV
ncbi:MAG: anthranilate phosphoribosyltransferase [Parashewanella sp.]